MSVVTELRLPRLDSDLDSSVLARPERRQATARLRREYIENRKDNFEDDKKLIRERARFAEHVKRLKTLKILSERDKREAEKERADKNVKVKTVWLSQIIQRTIPERPRHSFAIDIGTPRLRQPICVRNASVAPMFRTTRAAFSADKEKRRMHFISTEWISESVSWLRFHNTDLQDIHKLSWM